MTADLIAQLDPDTGHVWVTTPDGTSIPAPTWEHLRQLGAVYIDPKTMPVKDRRYRSVRFTRQPDGARAVQWLREHGYRVDTPRGHAPPPQSRPQALECATCSQGYSHPQVRAGGLNTCRACGADPLVLVSPPT